MTTSTVEPARLALVETAEEGSVGEYLGTLADSPGLVTERFACQLPGYRGWYWAVSLAVWDGAATVNDIVLLPGDDAIVAPAWMPYRDRVLPGDLGPGDVMPPEEDDIRLVPAWSAGDGDETGVVDRHFAREIGLGREWVLSLEGREDAADRWYDGEVGPDTAMAKQAPGICGSCGFMVSLAGDLSDRFGVCANKTANFDGRVVALTHGCGAHSGTRPKRSDSTSSLPDHVVDEATDELDEF